MSYLGNYFRSAFEFITLAQAGAVELAQGGSHSQV